MKRAIAAGMIFLGAAVGFAAQPVQFGYQAKLMDGSGNPLAGAHTLYFGVFQGGDSVTSNSGTSVYAESASVQITNGIVSTSVGAGSPTSGTLDSTALAFAGEVFLQVAVDSANNIVTPRSLLTRVPFAARALDAPVSLFGQFGGSGIDGDLTVSGNQTVGALRREYNNFTVPMLAELDVDQGFAFIGVRGVCTIDGTINADGVGALGGLGQSNVIPGANAGGDATGINVSESRVTGCASGAGGGGGGVLSAGASGADGGGASTGGGFGNTQTGFTPFAGIFPQIMAGGVSSAAGSGKTLTGNFAPLLYYRGAGGGGAGAGGGPAAGGNGGAGGGVIYLECNELVFSGTLTAKGFNGGNGANNPAGGGGGGGGGVILVRARKITTNTGTASAIGGSGGMAFSTGSPGAPGADGFWDIVEIK